MQSRQRLLNAIRGKETDRVPWSPFLAYYWESLPKDVQARGQFEYLKEMGADPLLRGSHQLTRCVYHNCEIHETATTQEKAVVYTTPVGALTERYVYSASGDTFFLVDHPVENAEQFKTLQYIFEHMTIEPNMEAFERDLAYYGDDALMIPVIGATCKTAFQSMVEHWVGTVNLTYELYDEPEVVEECLAVMQERDDETVKISINSAADGFIFWEDSSTTNISPSFFEKYTMPEVDRWGEMIHGAGKLLIHHACGHIRDLVPLMAQTKIDAIESISPPPTGNISLQDAAKMLPGNIALIGGLEPVRLLNESIEQVCSDAMELLRDMAGRPYVLANSDSCPPGVEYDKFIAITKLVRSLNA